MKRLLLISSVLLCCVFISCNDDAKSGNDKNVSAARDILKGIETGDTTKFASIAPDAVDHAGPTGEVSSGDSIKAYLADFHNHVRDLKIEILGEASDGDYVYTWSKMSGTALDSTLGFPANQPFSIRSVDIAKFMNGKVIEHWGFIDQHDLMMIRATQMPNATTVKVTMGDTSKTKGRDTATRQ